MSRICWSAGNSRRMFSRSESSICSLGARCAASRNVRDNVSVVESSGDTQLKSRCHPLDHLPQAKHEGSSMQDRTLYSIQESRRLLGGISRNMIYQLLRTGRLASVVIGSRRLISAEAIADLIERSTTTESPSRGDGASFQVPRADHAAPSVAFLCSRSYRAQSKLSFYKFLGTSTIPRRRSSAGRNLSDRLHRQAWHTMMPSPYPESTRKNSIRSGLSCAHKRARTRPVVFAPACR